MYGGEIGGGREYRAPPPIFSPPLTPFNPRHHTTYVTGKQTAADSEANKLIAAAKANTAKANAAKANAAKANAAKANAA